jgi:hypothetical protein
VSDRPEHCEIPGCMSLYVGTSSTGVPIHKCGRADLLVKDRFGLLRGICQIHYLRGLVDAGQAPNQDLLDEDGRMDPVKVRAHWDAIAQKELPSTHRRSPPPITAGLGNVLDSLDIAQPDAASPPDWDDRPW